MSLRQAASDPAGTRASSFWTGDPVDRQMGRRIASRREQLALSQADLADHLGISCRLAQKYEDGTNRMSAAMLVKIAARLHISVADLLGETPSPPVDAAVREHLAGPGAVELLQAFSAIRPGEARRALVTAARALGRRRGA